MLEQKKLYKLRKYCTRMKKSLFANNYNDYIKYCAHLKYNIGEQIGNGTNPELDKLFDTLTNFISTNKETYNVEEIKKKLLEEKTQLETKLVEYELQIDELKLNNKIILENKIKLEFDIDEYKKIIDEYKEKIKKDKFELDEIKTKSLETEKKIKLLETESEENLKKIKQLEIQILDKKNELTDTKNKLENAYLEDKIIDKLKDLQKDNYDKFINLLNELFTQIYDEQIAKSIIDEIDIGEIWKDNMKQIRNREETKILVNGKMIKWSEIIDTLNIIKTSGSKKLIDDINIYLNKGIGNINDLITRYTTELQKSIDKMKNIQKPINPIIPQIPITSYKPQTAQFYDYSKIKHP